MNRRQAEWYSRALDVSMSGVPIDALYPRLVIFLIISGPLDLDSSNETTAEFMTRLTRQSATPGMALTDFSILFTQLAQCIPAILSVNSVVLDMISSIWLGPDTGNRKNYLMPNMRSKCGHLRTSSRRILFLARWRYHLTVASGISMI